MFATGTFTLTEDIIKVGVHLPKLKGTKDKHFLQIEYLEPGENLFDPCRRVRLPGDKSFEVFGLPQKEIFHLAVVYRDRLWRGLVDLSQMRLLIPCRFTGIDLRQAWYQYKNHGRVDYITAYSDGKKVHYFSFEYNDGTTNVKEHGPLDGTEIMQEYDSHFHSKRDDYSRLDNGPRYLIYGFRSQTLLSVPELKPIGGQDWLDIERIRGPFFTMQSPETKKWGVIDARTGNQIFEPEFGSPVTEEIMAKEFYDRHLL